ncbi:MAG: response regulator [Desulfovibrionaceae bacterium]|nr:response regulator [Desulfovibrionaceae bacterium]
MRGLDAFISRFSIRTLTAILILCLTIPALSAVLFLGQGRFQLKKTEITNQVVNLARAFAEKHEDSTLHARTVLETIASQPGFADLDASTIQDYFRKIIDGNKQYSSLIFARPDGTLFASSASMDASIDFGDRPSFRTAITSGRFCVNPSVVSKTTGLPVLPFSLPVYKQGELAGVLLLGLRLDEYDGFLSGLSLPEGCRFVLFDRSGARLLRYPMREQSPLGERIVNWDKIMSAPGDSGLLEGRDSTGLPVTYAFVKSVSKAGGDAFFGVQAGIPSRHFTDLIRQEFGQSFLLLCLLAGAILAAGSLAASRLIFSGLIAMEAKVREITRTKVYGELGVAGGCREVRELGKSFDQMIGVLRRDKQVTEAAEEALRRSRDELESRVRERTRLLSEANRQLVQVSARAQEMAAQAVMANAAKSEFLAKMSHEIRTPMNAIMGMTELALQFAASPLQRDYLSTAMDSARNLLSIINDILDLSKIEARQLALTPVDFDLAELMDLLLKSFGVLSERKGLSLRYEAGPDLPRYLLGDAVRLRQVLTNLLGNAVKFTESGGVTVSVSRTKPPRPDLEGLRFVVADTGPGIRPDLTEMIFKPFAQGNLPAGRVEGTGLGLAIARSLVELMGGAIEVQSIPGNGSRFSFEVFLRQGDPAKIGPAVSEGFACVGMSFRVLVVDDNHVNLKVALALLRRLGHEPTAAHGGAQALSLLSSNEFDAVLMDLEMAGMDGLKATRRIRAGEAGEGAKNVTIMAMTAHALVGYRERCLEAGMNDFIAKPVSLADLIRVLGCAPEVPLAAGPHRDAASGRAEALLRLGGDERLLDELHGDFVSSLPGRVSAMSDALNASDAPALRQLAHGLKGVAMAVGENAISALAGRLETAAENGSAPDEPARALIAALAPLLAEAPAG